jgi:hypothetical protein
VPTKFVTDCNAGHNNDGYSSIAIGPLCFPKDIDAQSADQISGWNIIKNKILES